jgi:hypothetical protein
MLIGVFSDLKYFIAFFMFVLTEFGLLFTILVANSDTYATIGKFGYYLMAFRTSLGDFELDDYDNGDSISIILFRWFIWLTGVFIMNVIFMNFIIAVISESYEKVMQKLIAQSYKVKVDMIVDRELHLTKNDLDNPDYFPNYLILRRPIDSED